MTLNEAMVWIVRLFLIFCLFMICGMFIAYLNEEFEVLLLLGITTPSLLATVIAVIVVPKIWWKGDLSDLG